MLSLKKRLISLAVQDFGAAGTESGRLYPKNCLGRIDECLWNYDCPLEEELPCILNEVILVALFYC